MRERSSRVAALRASIRATKRHREPSGLAFGEPKDKLHEAISASHTSGGDCFVALRAPRNEAEGFHFNLSPTTRTRPSGICL
jgi:hypothetical protein